MRDQLGIKEQIARGETHFAGRTPPKIHNIKLAASRIHGVVVPPGAMFSFNRELGPTTLEAGYQIGWGIRVWRGLPRDRAERGRRYLPGGDHPVPAVFWGGYQIEERHRHLYWIPAYGVGALGVSGSTRPSTRTPTSTSAS